MENSTEVFRPSIVVDMKKNRIRIHQKTLHALGDPGFVMLIINPGEHTLGIKCSVQDEKRAHRVRKSTVKKECELYSKSLMSAFRASRESAPKMTATTRCPLRTAVAAME